ncbi:MAG: hypothetical protein MSL26_03675 [Clostridiales bacterium]|nr:hypothetical protein [Clostridiales bacterium]
MASAAVQQAQRKAPQTPKTGNQKKQESPKEKLYRLPRAAGIAILAALLVVSLFVGNLRALQNATPTAFLRQGDVKSIVEDRIDAAQNAQTVAQRAGLDAALLDAVDNAVRSMESAKTAREISRADQALSAAVSEMIDQAGDALGGENLTMLTRAADSFAEQGSFLRQEARTYNKKAEKADRLYDRLPTKFLLTEPDMYEGI